MLTLVINGFAFSLPAPPLPQPSSLPEPDFSLCLREFKPKLNVIQKIADRESREFQYPVGQVKFTPVIYEHLYYDMNTTDLNESLATRESRRTSSIGRYNYVRSHVKFSKEINAYYYADVEYFQNGKARSIIFSIVAKRSGLIYQCLYDGILCRGQNVKTAVQVGIVGRC